MTTRELIRYKDHSFGKHLGFNDILKEPSLVPVQQSCIIEFYSANKGIDSCTPILGIQCLLDQKPDTWNCHTNPVDFRSGPPGSSKSDDLRHHRHT
jgi:hypothetical protein